MARRKCALLNLGWLAKIARHVEIVGQMAPPSLKLRRDSPDLSEVEVRGITLPLVHPIMKPFGVSFYLHACGFGGKGIRTPDLLIANETLYQLSYTPILPM